MGFTGEYSNNSEYGDVRVIPLIISDVIISVRGRKNGETST